MVSAAILALSTIMLTASSLSLISYTPMYICRWKELPVNSHCSSLTESATLFSSNSSLGRHSAKRSFISLAQMVLSDGFDAMSFACFMST